MSGLHASPTVVDLFSGPGGTGLGFRRAGFAILAAVELDENAADTYQANLRVVVDRRDIRDVSPRSLRRKLALRPRQLDVLVGCPPCQGFTRMRNANGARDPRNALVLRYLEFVAEFRPRFAVFENVPGIVRTQHGRRYYRALQRGLGELGYHAREHIVDAADFGVPQHRVRVIVVAGRDGEEPPALRPTHGRSDDPNVVHGRRRPWITVRDVIGRGALPPVQAGRSAERDGRFPNHEAARTGPAVLGFLRRVPKDGGSRGEVPRRWWLPCHATHDGHSDVYGRLQWDAPANTITSGCTNPSKGRFTHPTQCRALTYREAAMLQGFPGHYRFHGGWIAEQIGNAVPPPLARAVAVALKRSLRANSSAEARGRSATSRGVAQGAPGLRSNAHAPDRRATAGGPRTPVRRAR